jgi:mono/diheme cytochrome c family protein
MRVRSTLVLPLLLAAAPLLGAQSTTADSLRSTLNGVFTEEQAAKGKDVFLGHCQSCHTNADLTSADFKADWVGKMLSEFFSFLRETMPESEPGSLSNEQYAAVTAYVLQLNGLPVGAVPLATTADSLAAIKFEVPPPGLAALHRQVVPPLRARWDAAPRRAVAHVESRERAAAARPADEGPRARAVVPRT